MQRDLPASLTVNATYLGTHGTNLIQEFLPNTYPRGARESVPDVPGGIRVSDVEWQLVAPCGTAAAPPPAA